MFKKLCSYSFPQFDICYVALCPVLTPSKRGIWFDVYQGGGTTVSVAKVIVNVEIHFGVPARSLTLFMYCLFLASFYPTVSPCNTLSTSTFGSCCLFCTVMYIHVLYIVPFFRMLHVCFPFCPIFLNHLQSV